MVGLSLSNAGPAGRSAKFGSSAGIGAVSSGVNPGGGNTTQAIASVAGDPANVTGASPSPMVMLIGFIGLLLALKYVGELESTAIRPSHVQIGGYNLLAVTVTSIVGISLFKFVFNRWQFPGITPLVNAV